MKTKYLILLAVIVAFSSCSTAYQTGQTPDDVYYSPAPEPVKEYVVFDNSEERQIRSQMNSLRHRNNVSLSIGYGYSPYYYSPAYGFGYSKFGYPYSYGIYDPYGYSYMPYFSTPYPFYNPFPYYYNSSYKGGYYGGYGGYRGFFAYDYYNYQPLQHNTGPRQYNLGTYGRNVPRAPRTQTVRGSDGQTYTPTSVPVRKFTPTQSEAPKETKVGGFIRKVFTPSTEKKSSNPTPNRTFERSNQRENPTPPTRNFTPPPSSSSSGSGSAPVRTFKKN